MWVLHLLLFFFFLICRQYYKRRIGRLGHYFFKLSTRSTGISRLTVAVSFSDGRINIIAFKIEPRWPVESFQLEPVISSARSHQLFYLQIHPDLTQGNRPVHERILEPIKPVGKPGSQKIKGKIIINFTVGRTVTAADRPWPGKVSDAHGGGQQWARLSVLFTLFVLSKQNIRDLTIRLVNSWLWRRMSK